MQIDVNRPVKFIWIVFNPSYELSLFPTFFVRFLEISADKEYEYFKNGMACCIGTLWQFLDLTNTINVQPSIEINKKLRYRVKS